MKDFKVIWTNDDLSSTLSWNRRNRLGYIKDEDTQQLYVYDGEDWAIQYAHHPLNDYRPATAREIKEHWNVLHPFWNPKPGDKVIITQNYGDWYHSSGTIVEKYDASYSAAYWTVKRDDDGIEGPFDARDQMIIAPYYSVPVIPTSNPVLHELINRLDAKTMTEFAIICPTKKQANDLFQILIAMDVKWNSGTPLDPKTTHWGACLDEMIYILSLVEIGGSLVLRLGYGKMSSWDYTKNLTIHVEAILPSDNFNQES